MAEPAAGKMVFRNGWAPQDMTFEQVSNKIRGDVETWVQGFDKDGNPTPWAAKSREWQAIDTYLNPDGIMKDRIGDLTYGAEMPGRDSPRARARADFAAAVFKDAIAKGLPERERTRLGAAFDEHTNALRQAMLFNVLNVPHYMAQNLASNTLNILSRGGGIKPAIRTLTDIPEMMRTFKNQRDPTHLTTLDARIKRIGMGDRPNIKQAQRPYFDRIGGGNPPKWIDIPLRMVAPESVRFLASVPDILGRDSVGYHALERGVQKTQRRVGADRQ
jgi:hypothetical protein